MRISNFLFFTIFISVSCSLVSQTYVNGLIATDATWTKASSPYVLDGDVTVDQNVTLTLEPGCILKFDANTRDLKVNGSLIALGTEANQIVFTSIEDDEYGGDTNGDGEASQPAGNDWAAVWLNETSTNNRFSYCSFLHGGGSSTSAIVQVKSSDTEFISCTFSKSGERGVYITDASPLFENCTISENPKDGLYFEGFDAEKMLTLTGNIFINNGDNSVTAILTDETNDLFLQNNTATASDLNGFGLSGSISGNVNYTGDPGFPFVLTSDLIVKEGASLNMAPGSLLKFEASTDNLVIDGSLKALGTEEEPIVFTHFTADEFGGDSNGDGDETKAGEGSNFFSTISLNVTSSENLIENCTFKYGGRVGNVNEKSAALRIYSSDTEIQSCSFINSYKNAIYVEKTSPQLEDCTFIENVDVGVHFSGFDPQLSPSVKGNLFKDNRGPAIDAVLENEMVDLILEDNEAEGNEINGFRLRGSIEGNVTFASAAHFPFVFGSGTGNDVVVNENATLNILPGTVVKMNQHIYDLVIEGSLKAEATPDNPIIITSISDDCYGGDTNNDGEESEAGDQVWSSIIFKSSSTNNNLSNVLMMYGGYTLEGNAMIYIYSNDLTMEDCVVQFSQTYGINISGCKPIITHCVISNNDRGIFLADGADPIISNNDITDNTYYGLFNDSENVLIATNNWWGSKTGPYESQSNPGGKGNKVTNRVDFIPWKNEAFKNENLNYPSFNCSVQATNVLFENTSENADNYFWDFGDGFESMAVNPLHHFDSAGVFEVCLTADFCDTRQSFCDKVTIRGVRSFTPKRGGNKGIVTITIYGGGFDENTFFKLKKEGFDEIEGDTIVFSRGILVSSLDLGNKPLGLWDLEVFFPGDTSYLFEDAFTIEESSWPDPWVEISGRNKILSNRPTSYTLRYGNYGNVDAFGVPVWIAVSDIPDLEIEFPGVEFESLEEDGQINKEASFFVTDTVLDEAFHAKVYSFILPNIPAKSTNDIKIIIKTGENFKIKSWVNEPFFIPGINNEGGRKPSLYGASDYNINVSLCVGYLMTDAIISSGKVLNEEEIKCFLENYSLILYYKLEEFLFQFLIKSAVNSATVDDLKVVDHIFGNYKMFKSCLSYNDSEIDQLIEDVFQATIKQRLIDKQEFDNCMASFCDNNTGFRNNSSCPECGTYCPRNVKQDRIKAVSSLDPNEKDAIAGYGYQNYIKYQNTIPYTIYFENKDSATAPAHTVRVIDTLDQQKFDFSTFEFKAVTIGDSTIFVEPGQKKLLMDFPLIKIGVVSRITATFDTLSGEINWTFQSMDPETLLEIDDPDIGFLPPNINKPEGEGNVAFYIDLKDDLKNKERVDNIALIYFDYNEPIETNVSTFSLDLESPYSSVEELEFEIADTFIPVSWTGTDEESGVRLYDVYVSENGEDFKRWIARTNHEFAVYKGEIGKNYRFFSVAVDSVGLEEAFPDGWDAETNLVVGMDELDIIDKSIILSPNPVHNHFVLEFYSVVSAPVCIEISNLLGQKIQRLWAGSSSTGKNRLHFEIEGLLPGNYLLTIQSAQQILSRKIVKLNLP